MRGTLVASAGSALLVASLAGGPVASGAGDPLPVFCNGRTATIVGTSDDDVLLGTAHHDVIVGLAGRDSIDGRGGNDVICGGAQADDISGGGGNDEIWARGGNDSVRGGEGDDSQVGGSGSDVIVDRRGDNAVTDGSDADGAERGTIVTGGGDDFVAVQRLGGAFTVRSGAGADYLWTAPVVKSADVRAGPGADTIELSGTHFRDAITLRLGPGDDLVRCFNKGCDGGLRVFGGSGLNRIDTTLFDGPVTVALGHRAVVEAAGHLVMFDFFAATTGDAADVVTGSAADDVIETRGGDDAIDARGGNDLVDGGDGNDQCLNAETTVYCEPVP